VERGEYARLAAAEERMWWFRALHAHLLAALAAAPAPRRLLDAGCGTGGLLARLAAALPETTLVGLELDPGAARTARDKSRALLAIGSVDRLPFAADSFDAVLSADVLCHGGVAEAEALQGFHRCLRPGGVLVLNLPAYRWLASAHDAAVGNARRYRRGELCRRLAEAGFARIRARYWNSLLFPLMVLRRKLWRRAGASDVELLPQPVERVFGAVVALERRLSGAGVSLPFGGSILAVAVKP
jgi:SAM-dependent methyltransferase